MRKQGYVEAYLFPRQSLRELRLEHKHWSVKSGTDNSQEPEAQLKKKESMYPKGSNGRCGNHGCREIAEYHVFERNHPVGEVDLCEKHYLAQKSIIGYAKRLPNIIRTDDGKLYLRCLLCTLQWRPKSFDLPKEDPDYGRIPHKCQNKKCKKTILTRDGRQPRFDRVK